MKAKSILTIVIVFTAVTLSAGGSDSIYFKRPHYLGITTGYAAYFDGILGHHGPDHHMGPFDYQRTYWGASYGVVAGIPFARKMEIEIALQGNFWKERRTTIRDVYYVPNVIPYQIAGISYDQFWHRTKNLTLRQQFSYELMRIGKFALNAGAAIWFGFAESGRYNRNSIGLEAVIKGYIATSRGSALQPSVTCGITDSGTYISLRVALELVGTRYYSKPKSMKYYVRTYED